MPLCAVLVPKDATFNLADCMGSSGPLCEQRLEHVQHVQSACSPNAAYGLLLLGTHLYSYARQV